MTEEEMRKARMEEGIFDYDVYGEYAHIDKYVRIAIRKRIRTMPSNQKKLDYNGFIGLCPDCGYGINSSFSFCPHCGKALLWREIE